MTSKETCSTSVSQDVYAKLGIYRNIYFEYVVLSKIHLWVAPLKNWKKPNSSKVNNQLFRSKEHNLENSDIFNNIYTYQYNYFEISFFNLLNFKETGK